jgi:glycosyltransferase involved in cell wall biosynthesis
LTSILVVTYWDFNDPLIQTYTLPYLKAIRKVLNGNCEIRLVTFNKNNINLEPQDLFIPVFFKYHSNKILAAFKLLTGLISLNSMIKKQKIDHIHSWCTPAGSIGYLLSKLSGKPLVLDSFEPHAESMVENGTWKRNSLTFKLLFRYEKLQLQKATHVIGLTNKTGDYIQNTFGITVKNLYLKPSCVNISDFSIYNAEQKKELRTSLNISPNEIVAIYAGKFGGIYLNEEIYQLLKCCSSFWKDNFKLIILTPNDQNEVRSKLKSHDLEKHLVVLMQANKADVVKYMNVADLAINPVKPVPSKRYCTSIKDGEYWACGLPVIITQNISDDSEIIEKEKIGSIIKSLNEQGYSNAVMEMDGLLKTNTGGKLNNKIKEVCTHYRSFSLAEKVYKTIYSNG